MDDTQTSPGRAALPSVDRLLRADDAASLIAEYGRAPVTGALRAALADARAAIAGGGPAAGQEALLAGAARRLAEERTPSLRPVFNLTGTVLHTNLGRAVLPDAAIAAVIAAAGAPANLEYDLAAGARGDRDSHLEGQLRRLTGAEAATVVNNNAAAVLLVLNTLATRREVPCSRGELIEIGGAFRMPDIMARSGCEAGRGGHHQPHPPARLRGCDRPADRAGDEGAHLATTRSRASPRASARPSSPRLCRARGVPFAVDLGCGTLVDLARWGLPHEPTAGEALAAGADLVTFSGDKLLGGPQAGIVVGRKDLVARLKRNPMKRALRLDKMTIAALAATLALYDDPDRLAERLPTLRLLARPAGEIRALAGRIAGPARGAARRRRHGGSGGLREPDRLRRAAHPARGERGPRDPAAGEARRRHAAQPPRRRAARPARPGRRAHPRGRADPRPALPRGRGVIPRAARPAGTALGMIVATAGHVDHGKTALVKALTGVDADRLPEEKARGLTIDLGFAYWPIAGGPTVGFVDVPGHERFVRNMLCGVSGIDFALFVVAADDGPMPQTAEHLAILDLLAVRRGAVALTKTDRVDAARVAEVEAEIARPARRHDAWRARRSFPSRR